ncbi:hypothetical protein C8R44DRAFT_733847 [Mycena epipterygia]|nr:hypothetical protein C8R44DRAFT_733847 [Mycena epipterygia]
MSDRAGETKRGADGGREGACMAGGRRYERRPKGSSSPCPGEIDASKKWRVRVSTSRGSLRVAPPRREKIRGVSGVCSVTTDDACCSFSPDKTVRVAHVSSPTKDGPMDSTRAQATEGAERTRTCAPPPSQSQQTASDALLFRAADAQNELKAIEAANKRKRRGTEMRRTCVYPVSYKGVRFLRNLGRSSVGCVRLGRNLSLWGGRSALRMRAPSENGKEERRRGEGEGRGKPKLGLGGACSSAGAYRQTPFKPLTTPRHPPNAEAALQPVDSIAPTFSP